MDCKHFEENAAAYVEGLLDGNLHGAMDKHRTSCPSCSRLTHVHKVILTSLNTTEPVKAPEGLAVRILGAVEAEKARVIVVPFPWRKTLIEAMAAALVLYAALLPLMGAILGRLSLIQNAVGRMTTDLMTSGKWLTVFDGLRIEVQIPTVWLSTLEKGLHLFIEPLQIPHVPIAIPPYFIAALALLAWSTWMYFESPSAAPLSPYIPMKRNYA